MDTFVAFVHSSLFGNFLAALVVIAIIIEFYRMHISDKNPINFVDLFLDKKTGKIGGSEFRLNTAFMATTWALIFLTLKGALTEWFLTAYLAAFVVDRIFSRNSSIKEQNVQGSSTSADEIK